MAMYRAKWSLGTEPRLMFDILHYTFLRLGDAHRFGPPHLRQIVRKMAVQIATEKSRGNTTVTVPVHPEFAESLRAGRAAGIIGSEVFTGKVVRGRVAAYADCTESQMMAMFGWTDPKMPAHYIAQANRERLGMSGMEKIVAFDQSQSLDDFLQLPEANSTRTPSGNGVVTFPGNIKKKA